MNGQREEIASFLRNRHFDKGLAGLHVALIHSEASVRSEASSIHFGAHGSLNPYEGFFINGLLRTRSFK